MIDTIVLTLQKHHYHIHNPELFTPSASWVLSGNSSAHISKQNPTSRDIALGNYKPRLTLANRLSSFGIQPLLKIEVSLPKLLFGNNFDELRYKDFSAVLTKLVEILHTMGITIAASVLASAPVSAIHYAKNIKLTDGSTPYHYINKIQEANVQWALDVNKTDYRNEGHSYKWHCNSYEVVFYDKIRDLEKAKQSSKRAIEKDSTLQLHLLNRFKKRKKLEFLRMEVRLNKRQKIKQLLQKLGIHADLTFKKLFKLAISRKILLHYLDEIEYRRPALLDYTSNDKALLVDLIFSNQTMSPKQVICLYGLKKTLEIMNPRELRMMFARSHPRSWQRFMNEVNKVKLSRIQSPFNEIRRQLMLFQSLKN